MVPTYQDLQEIIVIYLRWPSSWHYLDLLHHADESQRRRTITLLYRSGRVGVLQSYFFT